MALFSGRFSSCGVTSSSELTSSQAKCNYKNPHLLPSPTSCCQTEGVWVPGGGEAPDPTAEPLSQSVGDQAGIGWADLSICGAGVEGCCVWTVRSRCREGESAESRIEQAHGHERSVGMRLANGPGSGWLSGSWSRPSGGPAAWPALGSLRYLCILPVSLQFLKPY